MSAIEKAIEFDEARTELEDVLAYHDGDALAAVKSLLNDCRALRALLHDAEHLMSAGYTRKWKPRNEIGG